MNLDEQYLKILQELVNKYDNKNEIRDDRTGVGTVSVFRRSIRIPVSHGSLPILTTKRINFNSILRELLFFISGSTNINILQENNVNIWNEWADENGEIGRIYGYQWRNFGADENDKGGFDQLGYLIDGIKNNPFSRRHVLTSLNPKDYDKQGLFCCHGSLVNLWVDDGRISMSMAQRSCDIFLGAPYNITSYSILLLMICQITGYSPGELIIDFGDTHLYSNHIDQARTQLKRDPNNFHYPFLIIDPHIKNIDDFKFNNFDLSGYESYANIKAKVAV